MVNEVLNAMVASVYNIYGSGYKYYVEDVEQNLTKPCFTFDVLNPLSERTYGSGDDVYYRTVPCVIHFFTNNTTSPKEDCYSKAEQLMEGLEYITVEDKLIRGQDLTYSLNDDVLQVFVTYNMWTKTIVATDPNMETATIDTTTT